MQTMMAFYVIIALFFIFLIGTSVRILRQYERGVIFRLGWLVGSRGPGIFLIIPFWIERMVRVSLQTVVQNVPPQDVITKDNVSVKVSAILAFKVVKPEDAVVEVADYASAIAQISQTTLRSVLGRAELDEILSEREKLNQDLQDIISAHIRPWGIQVLAMEIRNVDLPEEMKRAMAKQAEAEREKRAKIINAEGEYMAAEKLFQAASIISKDPTAIQLRYLQTLMEIAAEKNSTTLFPIPIDLLTPFIKRET